MLLLCAHYTADVLSIDSRTLCIYIREKDEQDPSARLLSLTQHQRHVYFVRVSFDFDFFQQEIQFLWIEIYIISSRVVFI